MARVSRQRAARFSAVMFLTVAVLFVIAIIAEIFIADQVRPHTQYGYIVLSVVLAGLGGALLLESMGARLSG